MLDRQVKNSLRADIFRHLDGIVTAPTAYSLYSNSVLDYILEKGTVEIKSLARRFKANEGYLNVALHTLSSQGWIDYKINNENDTIEYTVNQNSNAAFKSFKLYEDVVGLMKFSARFHRRKFEKEPFLYLKTIINSYKNNYDLESVVEGTIEYQILKHIEGILVGPTIVALGMNGMFHKYFLESSFHPSEFHEDVESFSSLLDFFVFLGWFKKHNENYSFTEKGLFFARRASAYGVTVSYIPTLRRLDQLIFGNSNHIRDIDSSKEEQHVDRQMNVWGSGGAHSSYFKKMDEVLIEIFNRPLHEQPKGILDMGCGNGAFLIHAYNVISLQTLRGAHLEDHPLILVGADFNQSALKVTRRNIIKSEIWAKLVWGDIGDPQSLAQDLKDNFNILLEDLLNVRTFLDHNRIWKDIPKAKRIKTITSQGAFAYKGMRINNNALEENLRQHLELWKPYINKFGLLAIELHTISPSLISENLGKTPATAYNATHGYSDQYILELKIFRTLAESVGLQLNQDASCRFPESDLATVSINYFEGKI